MTDATKGVATHWKLQPSIICPGCSAVQIPNSTTMKSDMKTQVSIETTLEPYNPVDYFRLEPALHKWKAAV